MHEEMPAFPTICSQPHPPSALPGNWERAAPGTPALLGKLGPPFPRAVAAVAGAGALCPWEAATEGSTKSDSSRGGELRELCASLVEGSTGSFVPPCPPSGGAQHRIHFSSAVSTRLLVVGKVSNRTGKAMNSLKHKLVLLILVQAVSLAQGPLGLAQVLCTFMTDPLDWRGTDPDLQNSSGEKLQNFKNN